MRLPVTAEAAGTELWTPVSSNRGDGIPIPAFNSLTSAAITHSFVSFLFLMWTVFKVFMNLLQYCFCCLCSDFLTLWPVGS